MQYRALHDGWIAGQRVSAGDVITLTVEQSKYEPVLAMDDDVKPAARKAKAAPEVAPE